MTQISLQKFRSVGCLVSSYIYTHIAGHSTHARRYAVEANSPRYCRKFYGAHFMCRFSTSFEFMFLIL